MRHGVVVHYHEIGLKGRNRAFFERALVRNLRDAVRGCAFGELQVLSGRVLVHTEEPPAEPLLDRLAGVFGVAYCAPVVVVPADMEAMTEAALGLVRTAAFATFAVAARRATKELPFRSRDVNVELGAAVQRATGAGVNLDQPDLTIAVEVVGRRALVYVDRRRGPGGLPVGVSGRVVSLLSGGIDSAVATYRILRRGAKAVLCHFHSYPFTDRAGARKAEELGAIVAGWQGDTNLYVVPFGDTQQEIVVACPPALRVVMYRRFMVRVAAAIAATEGAKALVTGESLGQVASQTLENITCIEDASPLPVLRPLVGDDKQDIIAQAKAIGTYEISILPYADCCSLFVPASPATRAAAAECRDAESGLDVGGLVAATLERAELVRLRRRPCGES